VHFIGDLLVVTYPDGFPTHRQSPIQVVTRVHGRGLNVKFATC